mmetsp:Transcript_23437/g.38170  ORF Transcript_23437/g.38170 Transcript_23437/m.38170 type:complete len:263 (-) Transcript_23437:487-1275(-)
MKTLPTSESKYIHQLANVYLHNTSVDHSYVIEVANNPQNRLQITGMLPYATITPRVYARLRLSLLPGDTLRLDKFQPGVVFAVVVAIQNSARWFPYWIGRSSHKVQYTGGKFHSHSVHVCLSDKMVVFRKMRHEFHVVLSKDVATYRKANTKVTDLECRHVVVEIGTNRLSCSSFGKISLHSEHNDICLASSLFLGFSVCQFFCIVLHDVVSVSQHYLTMKCFCIIRRQCVIVVDKCHPVSPCISFYDCIPHISRSILHVPS